MVAIITADTKKRFIDDLKKDADLPPRSHAIGVDSASVKYYIGISKSEDWNTTDTAPTPVNSEKEQRDFRHALQSVKRVDNYSFVIPRENWVANTPYAAYSDTAVGHPTVPYYAMTENNAVYVCLRQGINAATGEGVNSTVQPSGVSKIPFTTSDGYAWKFLYTIGTLDAARFKSANFIPVKLQGATDGNSPATDIEQLGIQAAADSDNLAARTLQSKPYNGGRQIVGFSLDSNGVGYSSAPSVVITGNGTGAAGTAIYSATSNNIVAIQIADSATSIKMGNGYDFAQVTLSGGGASKPAAFKAVLGPEGGFGSNPTIDLRARAVMFNVKPEGTEDAGDGDGEFIVDNSFRQIGLLRNLSQTDSAIAGSPFTGEDGNCLRRLKLTSTASLSFTQRSIMTGTASGAKAFVNKVDSDEIWYHQTEETGFIQFQAGEGVSATGASGTVHGSTVFTEPKVDKYSGTLLYIENRAAVTRASDQTEDIKVIIEI